MTKVLKKLDLIDNYILFVDVMTDCSLAHHNYFKIWKCRYISFRSMMNDWMVAHLIRWSMTK